MTTGNDSGEMPVQAAQGREALGRLRCKAPLAIVPQKMAACVNGKKQNAAHMGVEHRCAETEAAALKASNSASAASAVASCGRQTHEENGCTPASPVGLPE